MESLPTSVRRGRKHPCLTVAADSIEPPFTWERQHHGIPSSKIARERGATRMAEYPAGGLCAVLGCARANSERLRRGNRLFGRLATVESGQRAIGLNRPKYRHCRHELRRYGLNYHSITLYAISSETRLRALYVTVCHRMSRCVRVFERFFSFKNVRLSTSTCCELSSSVSAIMSRCHPVL